MHKRLEKLHINYWQNLLSIVKVENETVQGLVDSIFADVLSYIAELLIAYKEELRQIDVSEHAKQQSTSLAAMSLQSRDRYKYSAVNTEL